jgi:hypothetical protein
MAKKLHRRKIPSSAAQQDAAEDGTLIEFSFKHLDTTDDRFDLSKCPKDYFSALLKSLQDYSHYTVEQFRNFNHQDDRHTIDPEYLRKHLAGKMQDEQLIESEAWGLKFGHVGSTWRAHGVLIYNMFYLIWLDPNHLLFRSKHPKYNDKAKS